MIGVCIEAGLVCPVCEGLVPLNGLAGSVKCPSCMKRLELSIENWHSILDDALHSAPSLEEDEGQQQTIFSSYNFKVMYGRQMPRYDGTRESIDKDAVLEAIHSGAIRHPSTGAMTPVRSMPEEYAREFQGILALVGESLPGGKAVNGDMEENANIGSPLAFQCPNCGGNLILDGTSRTTKCDFCSTDIYLPDDLWFALHPVECKKRWYLVMDESLVPIIWEREVWDAVQDGQGNYYLLLEAGFLQDEPLVVSAGPDRKLRWRRTDLHLEAATSRGEPKLALASGGRLLATCGDRSRLFVIDTVDGSTLKVLDAPQMPQGPLHTYFSMKGCYDFGVFPDDTLLLYRNCDRREDGNYVMDFQRADLQGNLLLLWPAKKMEKKVILRKLRNIFSGTRGATYLENTVDFPETSRDFEIRLFIGAEGSVCMLEFRTLVKLSPEGRKVYSLELPCNYTTGRPVMDRNGSVYVMAHQNNDVNEILGISPDGSEIKVISRTEKSGCLTVSPAGNLGVTGYGGFWTEVQL